MQGWQKVGTLRGGHPAGAPRGQERWHGDSEGLGVSVGLGAPNEEAAWDQGH